MMSSETDENAVQTSIDVDDEESEKVRNCNKNCDSGIDTGDSSSAAPPSFLSSDTELLDLSVKQVLSSSNTDAGSTLDNDLNSVLSTPNAISPDSNDASDNLLNLEECSSNENDSELLNPGFNLQTNDLLSLDDLHDLIDYSAAESAQNSKFDLNLQSPSLKTEAVNETNVGEAKTILFSEQSCNINNYTASETNITKRTKICDAIKPDENKIQENTVGFLEDLNFGSDNKNFSQQIKVGLEENVSADITVDKDNIAPRISLQNQEIEEQNQVVVISETEDIPEQSNNISSATNIDNINVASNMTNLQERENLDKTNTKMDKARNIGETRCNEIKGIDYPEHSLFLTENNNLQSGKSLLHSKVMGDDLKNNFPDQEITILSEKLKKTVEIKEFSEQSSLVDNDTNSVKPTVSTDEKKIVITDNMSNNFENQETHEQDKTERKEIMTKKFVGQVYTINNETNLTNSTTSLDEHNVGTHTIISKSNFSRSAENISLSHHNDKIPENLNSSDRDLNKENILNEFVNQKTKASATQKISPEVPKPVTEYLQNQGYARLPKELLHQDLGSLVKNVHGIFSSMSGSLKYAYNQTQKAPKNQIKNITRPIPNGKLMDDIFEDSEKSLVLQNDMHKSPVKSPMQYSELKNEDSTSLEGKEMKEDCQTNVYKLQLESMEKALADIRKENAILRDRVKEQVDELHERDTSFKEMEAKMEQLSKRLEQADREKDAAVMRYASVECTAIEAKRLAEKASAAEKAAVSEMELMGVKLRSAAQEKQRICQLYDDKCHELGNSEKELYKVREDVKELEGRLKWTQSKLRMEMEAYKEASERAGRLSQQVSELEAAKEAAVTNATDSARAKQLEQELKECQAALILCKHERDDLERRFTSTTQLLDICRKERDAASIGLAEATKEVERLKESNLRLEEEAAELAALRAQAALADTLSAQLHRESERALQAEDALSRERARAETCARREAAALQHAATLTARHVQQRASTTDTLHKAQALEVENQSLRERISSLEQETARLKTALSEESDKRSKETRTLARKVAEITEEAAEANKKLEWEKGENSVLRKKHANAIKELNRELTRALKRCEVLEAKLPPPEASHRTGSISSLSSGESAPHMEENNVHTPNGHSDALPDIQVREPDRQALIERIVSLQRAAARRAERCEFLEEHAKQLTSELRGKSRLLRHLLCSLPAGAVASSQSDAHKKEIARLGGGAMAAVWGGEVTGMTLELSLEMNNKLQAVLEDALLKNITLKENMDTLGEEIARLKGQMASNDKRT